ncbi:ankyrin repeat domain-containing protein [Niabella ginsengisoli]|uniref:Ankyrin repeat domain-containing protein n=1 Tax=Niabella ginsengisoli TaxID=522298 RepID=A0ABS9SPF7_9BACT|nr:ankyrin repeat domain-containing protein [Niabella ginsengisoli]MCH5600242.1 ankyrin repeat domain-containing protein [Niabella ginsengisoli]
MGQKLFKAVENSDVEKVIELLEKGEDPNAYSKDGLFPLWRAAADNNIEIAKILLKRGANVKQRDKIKPAFSTAISYPCQEGYLDMVKLLVENGADVNIKEFRDFTPIRIAARNGHLDIVKYLADKGAVIDIKAMDGATPLEHAASKGHYDIVKFLIDKGADINNQDNDGDFPLGEAAKLGYLEIIKLLLEKEANTNLKNKENKTALELARFHGQNKAAKLIEEFSK